MRKEANGQRKIPLRCGGAQFHGSNRRQRFADIRERVCESKDAAAPILLTPTLVYGFMTQLLFDFGTGPG
jgi:hypothetical protein